jgi:hypothetical protein
MRLASVLAVLLLAAGPLSAATLTVSPADMNGWNFSATDNNGTINQGSGTGDFVTGPATPPLGVGSAHMQTSAGNGDQSVQLRTGALAGIKVADLTALSYSTFATSWNGAQLPYLTIWVSTTGGTTSDDRLWFEPAYSNGQYGNNNPNPQPDVALNTWQTWNALQGMWYTDSNVSGPGSDAITLAAYLALFPDATIVNDAGQNIGGFRIATGFASQQDNFNTYVDNVSFATADLGTTTYNFEPAASPVPLPSSLLGGLTLLAALGAFSFTKRRAVH